jgi:tryptophanyl-tRNA synthetase
LHTYGFLGYPLLQAADILMYKAHAVPVGEDQVPHVEFTREVARRFNLVFGTLELPEGEDGDWASRASAWVTEARGITFTAGEGIDIVSFLPAAFRQSTLEQRAECLNQQLGELRGIFPEPEALLTSAPRLRGTDGRKMSKSYNNAIFLTDAPEVVSKKLATMMTDPARKRRSDPGNPDVCPVFDLHKVFSAPETIERVNRECRTAEIGCVDCKKLAAGHLNAFLAPIQERRRPFEQNPQEVWDILEDGTRQARAVAQATMTEVRAAVKLT